MAPDALSEREVEVLRLVATGRTNADIAEQLVFAPGTVARHASNILSKTMLSNSTELTTYAAMQGLIESKHPQPSRRALLSMLSIHSH